MSEKKIMTPKGLLQLSLNGLRRKFGEEMPRLCETASRCGSGEDFVAALREQVAAPDRFEDPWQRDAARTLNLFAAHDSQSVYELSRGSRLPLQTLTLLWRFLTHRPLPEGMPTDLFVDLYVLLMQFEGRYRPETDLAVKPYRRRWPDGLDDSVMSQRARNKERIVTLLIERIEQRHSERTRYKFEAGMTPGQKRARVLAWWDDYRFHLALAVKSPSELNLFLGGSLPPATVELLRRARRKGMPFFITPYYLSLLNTEPDGFDDLAIRSYVLYSEELVDTYGGIKAWEREDEVVAGEPNAAGWLLPEGHNIHRRYPEVAIMIPDSMGRACGGLCAVCQRMYDFQSQRLNFDFAELKPKESWDHKLSRLMRYFEEDSQLRDILITGGDALMSQNATLRKLLDAVYRMAVRKRRANRLRPEGGKYAELQRVRLGSRLPAYLPMRVNAELVEVLREFREKASLVGVRQFVIQTHFQSPLEVTPEARKALSALRSAGWIVTNQHVYTVASSRRGHAAKLRRTLNQVGVVPYYTFSVKGFGENYALFTPNSRSMQEAREEKSDGRLSEGQVGELLRDLQDYPRSVHVLTRFMRRNHLPFLATDRNVLNLPGIGKSMTFQTVGIDEQGRRVLCFDHDHGRRHSPIIDRMGRIYIVENKSLAAYLRQLREMGETVAEYRSLWSYRSGETEPLFPLFRYPEYGFGATERFTNLGL